MAGSQYFYNDGDDLDNVEVKWAVSLSLLTSSLSLLSGFIMITLLAIKARTERRLPYRTHLVLLLLVSDFLRALPQLWLSAWIAAQGFLPAVVKLQSTDKALCTASGYTLFVFTRSEDVAILVIAVHSFLAVRYPHFADRSKGGIYDYRFIVYFLWIVIPVLTASLIFIGFPANQTYVFSGSMCYMNGDPIFWNLFLSWVPRYIVFILIVVLYGYIYFHARAVFAKAAHATRGSTTIGETPTKHKARRLNESFSLAAPRERRVTDESTISPLTKRGDNEKCDDPQSQRKSSLNNNSHSSSEKDHQSQHGTDTPSEHQDETDSHFKLERRKTSMRQQTFLLATEVPPLDENAKPDTAEVDREVFKRQLTYVFIYPAAYILIWFFPAMASIWSLFAHTPIWLNILVSGFYPINCFVDSLVYALKEKPWRNLGRVRALSHQSIISIKKKLVGSNSDSPFNDSLPQSNEDSPNRRVSIANSVLSILTLGSIRRGSVASKHTSSSAKAQTNGYVTNDAISAVRESEEFSQSSDDQEDLDDTQHELDDFLSFLRRGPQDTRTGR
ncbi:hypothetical protein CANCADRAFT_31327 [Tortispora caseinolytica NRRL Y-17796]|uniref:G-protein coupled receptors family 1 profile domain-containing protein n=1 Tax=Tortispora caseinolytica NRRL Y-17796 TaxID=767744 RepID=A0A1E4TEX2_9ASCO|nr:hypothetical protein CANCADRAFT_31327 [Tortispora caseinolytica NRRL Y-17796]